MNVEKLVRTFEVFPSSSFVLILLLARTNVGLVSIMHRRSGTQ
jgi:hypothetical protein